MLILGIESSCDDTSVALVNCGEQGHVVISEKTASQIEIHKKYGGVVPEIAGRMHAEKIVPLIEEVTKGHPRPEAIAVTSGPGLVTGLIVGTEAAKTLALAWKIPLIGINHIEGHIHSVEISNNKLLISQNETVKRSDETTQRPITNFPALCLVVSGGHTELILMSDHGDYKILGKTKDDAAGECFDKVAKLLDLPYPGGPKISQLAETGRATAIEFPRPMLGRRSSATHRSEGRLDRDNFDFSFAGLKTSALYWLRDNQLAVTHIQPLPQPAGVFGIQIEPPTINDFCASFETAIVETLIVKTLRAAKYYKPKTIILAGGVSANKKLRLGLEASVLNDVPGCEFRLALPEYCMDNAAMIAVAGYYHALKKDFSNWQTMKVDPNWKIDARSPQSS